MLTSPVQEGDARNNNFNYITDLNLSLLLNSHMLYMELPTPVLYLAYIILQVCICR